MKHKIAASTLFNKHYLEVSPKGVRYVESGLRSGRKIRFEDIVCVLMGPGYKLSFQVGQDVFSITTRPDNPKHQAAIEALVAGVQQVAVNQTQS